MFLDKQILVLLSCVVIVFFSSCQGDCTDASNEHPGDVAVDLEMYFNGELHHSGKRIWSIDKSSDSLSRFFSEYVTRYKGNVSVVITRIESPKRGTIDLNNSIVRIKEIAKDAGISERFVSVNKKILD
jgi:hypothetical protein